MAISSGHIVELFAKMEAKFKPEKALGMDTIIQFQLSGEEETTYWIQVQNQNLKLVEGMANTPAMTVVANAEDYVNVINGETSAIQAFMSGKLQVKGDMTLAMKLQSIFGI